MQPNPHERALAVFDAFLRYAREGRSPASGRSPAAPPSQESRSSQQEPEQSSEETTDPNLATMEGTEEHLEAVEHVEHIEEFEEVPTRQSKVPESLAASMNRDPEAIWDEPTRERPDVVQEMRSQPPPAEPASYRRMPQPIVPENSIIVDDVALTEPVQADDLRSVRAESRVDTFLAEMTVLIKYGHAVQVPREIERWIRANADDLNAHLRVAEFERTRVDVSTGLDRLFWIASRALDRGVRAVAARVLEIVDRDAPGDMRRAALQDRVGGR